MKSRMFGVFCLRLYGLLLSVLKCYALTTTTNRSASVGATHASIMHDVHTSSPVLSTFKTSDSNHKMVELPPVVISNKPRSPSHGTGAPSKKTAEATTEVERDGASSLYSSSNLSSNFNSGHDGGPEVTPGGYNVTSINAEARLTDSSEDSATTAEMMSPRTRPARFSLDSLRASIKQFMSNQGRGLLRNVLQTDISTECSIGLLKFARAIQELEPWAFKLIDATGKYPTGLFQATVSDLGAYDECIETVVKNEEGIEEMRGQYCDVHVLSNFDDTDVLTHFLPAMTMSFKRWDLSCLCDLFYRAVVGTVLKITVKDCVTSKQEKINRPQASIITFLVVLVTVIAAATAFDVFTRRWRKNRKSAVFYQCIVAFSALANTRLLLTTNTDKNSETACYKFIHGLRVLSIFWICLGHAYVTVSENISRIVNAPLLFERWDSHIISSVAFLCVDTFFFLSGYLLYEALNKMRMNRAVVAVVALFRRCFRTTIPLFFVIMCMYLFPLTASGPNSKEFYDWFYADVREHWWDLVLQISNWRLKNAQTSTLLHLWFLSADYQLFLVAVIVIQVLKAKKWLVAAVFATLALVCCSVSAWRMYGTDMTPFIVMVRPSFRSATDTAVYYYFRPYYHGVCFFGCITLLLVQQYRKSEISKTVQTSLWVISLFCGLYCIFMKVEWYRSDETASIAKRMFFAFIDRILWTVFLVWFTFACITGRGGFLNQFLSWSVFAPLARLSFGVYLIHYPFYLLTRRLVRERIFYSHYTLVSECFAVLTWSYIISYFLFIACEAPLGRLDKLAFVEWPRRRAAEARSTENGEQCDSNIKAADDWPARSNEGCTAKNCLNKDCFQLGKISHHSESCASTRWRF